MMAGPNAMRPDRLSPEERLTEVAEILATVIIRRRRREKSVYADTSAATRLADPEGGADEPFQRS
jgi:hypothetical protein